MSVGEMQLRAPISLPSPFGWGTLSGWRLEHPEGQGPSPSWDELQQMHQDTKQAPLLWLSAMEHGELRVSLLLLASDIQRQHREMTAICVPLTPEEHNDIAVKMRLVPHS